MSHWYYSKHHGNSLAYLIKNCKQKVHSRNEVNKSTGHIILKFKKSVSEGSYQVYFEIL